MSIRPPSSPSASSVAAAKGTRTAGNVTLNSTTWANVDTATDVTVDASEGDVLQVGMSAFVENQAVYAYFKAVTVVSGSPVNSIGAGGAAEEGVQAWLCPASLLVSVGGTVLYTVQAGDIENGQVKLRLQYRTLAATNRTCRATAANPLEFNVVNFPAG